MEELEKMLKSHDWFYAFSDDPKVYMKGYESMDRIQKKMIELGNTTEVKQLYTKYNKALQ